MIPFDYVKGFKNFSKKSLPLKEAFFNHLRRSHISYDHYQHEIQVFDLFKRQTIGEYSDHYLPSGAPSLTGAIVNSRGSSPETYDLDPLHLLSLSFLSWMTAPRKMAKLNWIFFTAIWVLRKWWRQICEVW